MSSPFTSRLDIFDLSISKSTFGTWDFGFDTSLVSEDPQSSTLVILSSSKLENCLKVKNFGDNSLEATSH